MIADRLKQARIAIGMTQDEVVAALAEQQISLTKGGLSKYERGGSTPKATVLRALARVFGVDASFFLEEPSIQVQWLAFRKASRMGKKPAAVGALLARALPACRQAMPPRMSPTPQARSSN